MRLYGSVPLVRGIRVGMISGAIDPRSRTVQRFVGLAGVVLIGILSLMALASAGLLVILIHALLI